MRQARTRCRKQDIIAEVLEEVPPVSRRSSTAPAARSRVASSSSSRSHAAFAVCRASSFFDEPTEGIQPLDHRRDRRDFATAAREERAHDESLSSKILISSLKPLSQRILIILCKKRDNHPGSATRRSRRCKSRRRIYRNHRLEPYPAGNDHREKNHGSQEDPLSINCAALPRTSVCIWVTRNLNPTTR